jgi:hypothetical protein
MIPRAEWQGILDSETKRWSSMLYDDLVAELRDVRAYAIEVDSKQYQVESAAIGKHQCLRSCPGRG